MRALAGAAGIVLLAVILWDGFETIILPRRVTRYFRLTRLFYRYTWMPWAALARRVKPGNRRETFLSYFGPLSLLSLFAVWAVGLIVSFGLLHWAAGSAIDVSRGGRPSFFTDVYLSGTTFFTLGIGDVTPRTTLARIITVGEAGMGFGVLAIVIAYLPVMYAAFSQREVNISLMDARAGSPPSAAELLRRHGHPDQEAALATYLGEWETWSAQLMESHLSYPVLCFFRSQHSNQSWLASLSTMLDCSAFLIAYAEGSLRWQAQLTFAMARHAVVDLSQVLFSPPQPPMEDRLPEAAFIELRAVVMAAGMPLSGDPARERLRELRNRYESYLNGLSRRLLMPLSPWIQARQSSDNWQTSAWRQPVTLLDGFQVRDDGERQEHK
ncbi:MAG: potassium channel family protein [Terriglobia bacterium]